MNTQSPPTPLLQVTDLRVHLHTHQGAVDAVRGIDFTLHRGETLGLVGESGCGKSLTALALMGLLPDAAQASGSILLDGQELVGLDDRALCRLRGNRIGMVFQEPMTALNPVHRIGDQVAEPLRLHRGLGRAAARREALALLERVGIADAARRLDAYPHQFSGGQRQRITIAMALACGPDLLIADEPTTALDSTVQAQMLDLLQKLVAQEGMAMILISHDLALVARHVQRISVLYAGRVLEQGSSQAVFSHAAHPYTRALLAARPRLDQPRGTPLASIGGCLPDLYSLPQGCRFAERCQQAQDVCRESAPPERTVPADGPPHCVRCFFPQHPS